MGPTSDLRLLARDAVASCRLFAGLDAGATMRLADALRVRRFRRGEVIFHAGDPGDSLFIVAAGSVKITVSDEGGEAPAILTTVGPAGFFGELALLDGAPRSATATALDAVQALVLRREELDRMVDSEPGLRRALLAALAGEIRRLTAQVEDLHFLDLPGRLAKHLLRQIGDDADRPASTEARLPWPYTQGELAHMIGGSRQSVNRLLADFVDRGLIRFDGDDLVVPDPRRLSTAARR